VHSLAVPELIKIGNVKASDSRAMSMHSGRLQKNGGARPSEKGIAQTGQRQGMTR
jgi:hypothetical protein